MRFSTGVNGLDSLSAFVAASVLVPFTAFTGAGVPRVLFALTRASNDITSLIGEELQRERERERPAIAGVDVLIPSSLLLSMRSGNARVGRDCRPIRPNTMPPGVEHQVLQPPRLLTAKPGKPSQDVLMVPPAHHHQGAIRGVHSKGLHLARALTGATDRPNYRHSQSH
jgi:hypothetical protein